MEAHNKKFITEFSSLYTARLVGVRGLYCDAARLNEHYGCVHMEYHVLLLADEPEWLAGEMVYDHTDTVYSKVDSVYYAMSVDSPMTKLDVLHLLHDAGLVSAEDKARSEDYFRRACS